MRKGLLLLLFCVVVLTACGGGKTASVVKKSYRVSFSQADVVVLDTSYTGYVVDDAREKLKMKLENVHEDLVTGGFHALLSIDTQFTQLPVQGGIEPYVNNQPPVADPMPFILDFTYLDTLWIFNATLDRKSGMLSGVATTGLIGEDDPWSLSPL